MAKNRRIYYAIWQAGIKPDGTAAWVDDDAIHGLQSVGITTNFNLTNVLEIGMLQNYESIEELPDVEISLTKVLDGYPPMYLLATQDADTPTLAGRANSKSIFGASIFNDTLESATGAADSQMEASGTFVGSVSYNIGLDDNMTEDITLVGNNKIWKNDAKILSGETVTGNFSGAFSSVDSPLADSGVARRQDLILTPTSTNGLDVNGMAALPDVTVLPPDVFGVNSSGINLLTDNDRAYLSRISVSVDFGRESINELGRKGPYHRAATFPIDVTTEIEVTAHSGDMISATERGILSTDTAVCTDFGNLRNRTIRIATCEGLRIYTGTKNKLSAVNFSGADAGGGNATASYTFLTSSHMTVMHENDPNTNFLWADRADYLIDT